AEFDLPADGSVVSAGVSLPEGTEVSFVEGELPQAPEGYVFESSQLSADSITILADGNEDIAWSVTNTYVSDDPAVEVGGFVMVRPVRRSVRFRLMGRWLLVRRTCLSGPW